MITEKHVDERGGKGRKRAERGGKRRREDDKNGGRHCHISRNENAMQRLTRQNIKKRIRSMEPL